ncbi:multiple sugar transport system ATP-binding protein [Micromonospora phaseoli]|uniref:Multiple sugar transport system ATP-binding protein n=1 Tax=Micromonospora phaseoli TaxID=1144548 RepID=A0A1H6Z3Z7_9ACTN|nr:sn-glycerol-3-phosphate ABC transporter ATP-binding protein UgpC [Micromonospora phaseoli]PZW00490.1 multiple sugar transport system ATP-binding protein [Micromonospora phaseoli]GIJ80951.1 sugar ABC transporter ATP-binding protein [Micromonospora phaseoli]SEJ46117.1 multiple sugar transport system ATP-binding protein [Micromonospora phaseoli]
MATVRLDNVTKVFPGGARVLDGVSLSVHEGEFLVLVGPSGCGKSTVLRIVAGLEEATCGTVLIDDEVVDHVAPKERDVAMVFQNYALYPHLSVRDNLAFSMRLRHVPARVREQRVLDVAHLLGIDELLDRKPKALSGGQRQRVATGRAIVRDPHVLLMDEPLSNLDAQLRVTMRAELRRLHAERRTTTIYVTHDQVEAMTLGDRIAVLEGGRVHQIGTPHDLYHRPVNAFVAGFIGSPSMNLTQVPVSAGDPPMLQVAGRQWPIPATLAGSLATLAGDSVLLGLRPDAFTWPAPESAPTLDVTVAAVEFLGGATLVFFEPPGEPWHTAAAGDPAANLWTARLGGNAAVRVGERRTFGVDLGSAYLFDAEEGRALRCEEVRMAVPA